MLKNEANGELDGLKIEMLDASEIGEAVGSSPAACATIPATSQPSERTRSVG